MERGSGGGAGFDIGPTGLSDAWYVRVTGASGGVEVDAFALAAPIPEPALTALLGAAFLLVLRRARRRSIGSRP